ncbi:MAG TPA: SH3 domain-containing protein, partial [Chitinophagaceae bacterium]|nr:SH3 domain-containing protein [Chitinophagaceae bacterium]
MDYAIVSVPAAPMRRKPRHQREMTSQLLFGEAVQVLREKGELWVKVQSLHDEYEGWMTRTLLAEVSEKEATAPVKAVTTGLINTIHINGQSMHLPMGASLPALNNGKGKIGALEYEFSGNNTNPSAETASGELI